MDAIEHSQESVTLFELCYNFFPDWLRKFTVSRVTVSKGILQDEWLLVESL